MSHEPTRPGWMCEPCDTPWPCDTARMRLRERYAHDPIGLAEHLADQLVIAAREAGGLPAELHERFVGWTP